MSKRLQILINDNEFNKLTSYCHKAKTPIAQWVRSLIQEGLSRLQTKSIDQRLAKVLQYAKYQGPTADMDEILGDLESSYARNHDLR